MFPSLYLEYAFIASSNQLINSFPNVKAGVLVQDKHYTVQGWEYFKTEWYNVGHILTCDQRFRLIVISIGRPGERLEKDRKRGI